MDQETAEAVAGKDDEIESLCDDLFADRRLSQIVADIFDRESNIGLPDCLEDAEDESLKTDFIDYSEEPKNKELFRNVFRICQTKQPCNEANEASNDANTHSCDNSLKEGDNQSHESNTLPVVSRERKGCNKESSNKKHLCETDSTGELSTDTVHLPGSTGNDNREELILDKANTGDCLLYIDEDTCVGIEKTKPSMENNELFPVSGTSGKNANTLHIGSEYDTENQILDKHVTHWSVTSV